MSGRRLLRLSSQHRLRGTLLTAGVAIGVLAVGLAAGFFAGKLKHSATYHGTGSLPPVATTTSTTTGLAPAAEALLKTQLVEDMTLDVESQRLEADIARRASLAQTPAAVAARHAAITTAWAPDQASAVEVQYDKLVVANAHNRTAPSVLDAEFVVKTWLDITVEGADAVAILQGHYRLTEASAIIDQKDQVWTISLRETNGRWQLERRGAV